MTVVKKDSDSVSRNDSAFQKVVAELIGTLVDLLIGEGAVLENQGMLLRSEKAPFSYPIANIDHNITHLWNNGKLDNGILRDPIKNI